MFKPGRGGGGRRPAMVAPPPRPGGSLARAPISGASRGRGRGKPATSASAPSARDETFSLELGGPPDFASIVRLTPDLVDEIRRCEVQGGSARIKFGSNPLNSSENVIEVGLKEYNFTWSPELGVCDIYEVHRNGEDGNGLLIERGSALRKMNVQRILDESAKNQVKMRSVQAELQSKSRKSIILDPANPSVQKQVKSMAAANVEGSMRRWGGSKDKFFKKSNQAPIAAPPKTITKVVPPSSSFAKTAPPAVVSPAPSPPQHLTVETIKEEITPQNLVKDENKKFEKRTPVRSGNGLKGRNVNKNSSDLRGLLIDVLSENPKGLSLKALEKAVGDSFPDSAKKIEIIVKTIATYQAPGRYILKPGFAPESSKWHTSDRSSPENAPEFLDEIEEALREEERSNLNLNKDNKMKNNVGPPPTSALFNLEEEPMDDVERIDIEGGSSPLINNLNIDINITNNESEEGKAAASSSSDDSDSDSDSDTSDNSGSDRSTRSPAGSGSQSSSQSDSSSSSDDDVEVNITSGDEKETHQQTNRIIIATDLNLSPSSERARGQNGFATEDPGLVNITSPSPPLINLNDNLHVTPVTASGTGVDIRMSEEEENLEQFLGESDGKVRKVMGERRPGPTLNPKPNSNLKRPSAERLLPGSKRPKTGPRANRPVELIPVGESKAGTFPERSPNIPPDRNPDWDWNVNVDSSGIKNNNTALRPGNNRSNISSSERFSSDEKSARKHTRDPTNSEANDNTAPLAKRLRESSSTAPPPQRNVANVAKSPAPAGTKKILRREMSELELGEFREPGATSDDEFRRLFGSSSSSKPEDDDEEEEINIIDNNKINNNNNANNNNNNSINSNNKMDGFDNNSNLRRGRNVQSASPNIDRYTSGSRARMSEKEDRKGGGAHSSRSALMAQVRPPNNNGMVGTTTTVKKPSKVNNLKGELSRNVGPTSCDDAFYLKYNKDQPDLKGPINTIAQFDEYIKEYQDKYDVYLSLNKQLEEYRDRYAKMGVEMDAAKGKSTSQYTSIVDKMREMFRQDKERHSLMKKIFLILHEELGTIKEKLSDFYEEYNQNLD